MCNLDSATSRAVDGERKLHTSDGKHKLLEQHSQQQQDSLASRWFLRRTAVLAWLIASLILLVTLVEAQDALDGAQSMTRLSPSYLHVEIKNDRVTLKARDVSILDLVTEIARRTELTLVLYRPLDERVTMEINELFLPEALARILQHKSFALRYARPLSSHRDSGRKRANRLWVLPARLGDYPPLDKLVQQFSPDDISDFEVPQAGMTNTGTRLTRPSVDVLNEFDVDEATLSRALDDEDANVRVKAIHALADIGGDQAVAALVGALGDDNARIRVEATHALGEIGSDTAIEILEQPSHDADTHVRQAAIDALTDIGGDDAAGVLATALRDEHVSLRTDAVYALGEIGGETAIGLLQRALADHAPSIRELAAEILDDLSGQRHRSRGACVSNPCPN